MQTRMLKPARDGLKVATPAGGRLKPAGELVAFSTYWARRLADGDVVEVRHAKPTPARKGRGGKPQPNPTEKK